MRWIVALIAIFTSVSVGGCGGSTDERGGSVSRGQKGELGRLKTVEISPGEDGDKRIVYSVVVTMDKGGDSYLWLTPASRIAVRGKDVGTADPGGSGSMADRSSAFHALVMKHLTRGARVRLAWRSGGDEGGGYVEWIDVLK